jgi:3-mercaptopyruvate sulfurtransferase SseA
LIVSGYSFGDKAINSRIIQWLDSLPSRKIIIIHPDPNYLLEHVRNAIRISWHRWLDDKKLFILQKSVEETNWDELKKMLTK